MPNTPHLRSWNSGAIRILFWCFAVVLVLGARVERSEANLVTITLTGPNGPPIISPASVACSDHTGTIVIGQWGPYGVSNGCTAFDECRVEVNSACQARVQYWDRCSSARSRFPVSASAWTAISASSGGGCCNLWCNIVVSMPLTAAPSTAPTTVSPTATTSPPSYSPTATPTPQPTAAPSSTPTPLPTGSPTDTPTISPTMGRSAAPTTGAPTSSAPTAVNQSNHSSVSDKTSETVDVTIVAAVVITLLGVCIVGSASACFRRRRQRAKARTIDQMKGPAVTDPRFNLSSQHGDGDVYEVPVLATQAYSVFRSVDNVSAVYEAPRSAPQRHEAQSRDADSNTQPAGAKQHMLRLDESMYVVDNSEYMDVDL
jgi:hypothetical protein